MIEATNKPIKKLGDTSMSRESLINMLVGDESDAAQIPICLTDEEMVYLYEQTINKQ